MVKARVLEKLLMTSESNPRLLFPQKKDFDLNFALSSLCVTPVKLHSVTYSRKQMKGQKKIAYNNIETTS